MVLAVSGFTIGWAPAMAAEDDPVVVWPSGPLEVIVASGGPIAAADASAMVGRAIAYDDPRSERTGAAAPAHTLRIVGARLADGGRTLVLATDPNPIPALYRLPWPPGRADAASAVTYDLSGAEAAWSEGENPAGEPSWTLWWPALDPEAARRVARVSRRHEAALATLDRPGRLVLSAWVRLPAGQVTFRVRSSRPIEELTLGDAQATVRPTEALATVAARGEPVFLMMTVRTGAGEGPLRIEAGYRVAGEAADHPIDRG